MLSGIAEILSALTWPAVFGYAVWKFAPVVQRFAPQGTGVTADDVAVPEDLIAYAASYTDSWAQDDTMRSIREKYAEHKDWNKVRSAFGFAHTPVNK